MTGDHAGAPLPEHVERALAQQPDTRKNKHVRVTTEAPAGSDPTPAPEPSRSSGTENDARLKADKPPHWG
jgi:hypothetical protein